MNFFLRKSVAAPLLAVILVFGLVVWMSVNAITELLRSRDQIENTHEFLRSLVSILALATDTETGQRGFILTGDESYLEPYLAAQKGMDAELRRAATFVDSISDRRIALTTLANLISGRSAVLEQQIALRKEKGLADAVEAVQLGPAKAAMDHIRLEIAGLSNAGNSFLSRNRLEARQALRRATIAGLGGSGVCVLLFAFVFYRIRREMLQRGAAENALRAAHGDLEVRVAARTSELRKAEEEARLAWQKAEAASEAKSEFLSRVSHELRTPLNAILGFGQLMEMGLRLPSEQSSNLQHIMRGGRHLLDLVDELLDLTAVESGRLPMSLEPVLLQEAISEVVSMLTPQARHARVQVTVHSSPLVAAHVTADRQRLKQVFLNLLSNAVKFNRPGGSVDIGCEVGGENRLRVYLRDTGAGIAAADLPKLFSPFERLGDGGQTEGIGLGLILCQRLVTAMGGTIGVESEVGRGSNFWIELVRAEDLVPSPPSDIPAVNPSRDLAGKTILYIEDNLANLKLLEHILADRRGVTLLSSMQGSIGLELARSRHPDLILLDTHLPDIDGREVLRRLRSDPATRDTPVFILSADDTPRRRERLLNAGAQAFIAKPIDVPEFLALLDRTLAGESLDPRAS